MEKAREMQLQLAKRVIQEDTLPETIQRVAGVDVAYVGEVSIGAAAVLDYDSMSLLEGQTAHTRTRFPYCLLYTSDAADE